MSTNVASVVSHFPDAENGFSTSTSGSVSSGAVTVGLNSVAGYTNGEPVVLVIDPSNSKKQTFTGIVDTSGVQVTSVVWTAGSNVAHDAGATVVDYATATHIAMISKGIKVNHTQKANHKTQTDDNANEWIKQTSAALAVNEITVANAATGNSPDIAATGDDTNISLTVTPKGTGNFVLPAGKTAGLVRSRQGGSSTDWQSQGTTTYDYSTTSVFVQVGARTMNTSFASTAITFPTAYNQKPLVFVNVQTANSANVIATAKDVTTTGFNLYTNNSASGAAEIAAWMAIGQ